MLNFLGTLVAGFMLATSVFAADSEPHLKTKVCNPGETLCADVTSLGGKNRIAVDSLSLGNNAISTANSTMSNLSAGATFTGTFEDVTNYADMTVVLKADQASAASGFAIDWSTDGSTIVDTDSYTLAANVGKQYSFGIMAKYVRIKYTNGAAPQTSFKLQTVFKGTRGKPSSHRIDDVIIADDDSELVKAVLTVKKPNGTYANVNGDENGNILVAPITGFGSDFSFGDISTASIAKAAVRRTTYNEQTSNAQRSISSSSANDTSAGTGARQVRVRYCNAAFTCNLTETLTMNGTTPVNTSSTTIAYIEEIEVVSVGSTGSNVGTITLFVSTAGGGGTIGTVGATDNRTFWAHHYVGIGKKMLISGLSVSHNGTTVGSGGVFAIQAKDLSSATSPDIQISDFVRLYGQSSSFARAYSSPIPVNGPARVVVYVTPESGSSFTYRAAPDFFEQ